MKTIFNLFVIYIPPLDYDDIVYDQTNKVSLSDEVEFIATLTIAGTIKDTSREKFYQELGLESLRNERWLR